jgi:hypothetical protein
VQSPAFQILSELLRDIRPQYKIVILIGSVVGQSRYGDAAGMQWTQHPDLLVARAARQQVSNQQARTTSRTCMVVANRKRP